MQSGGMMVSTQSDLQLKAHLFRRAAFGTTASQLEIIDSKSYGQIVDDLLDPDAGDGIDYDVLYRHCPDFSGGLGMAGAQSSWLYRMVVSDTPLIEKMALFWHGVFATGYSKLTQGKIMNNQIQMFRRLALGNMHDILMGISTDPAMMMWLDNDDNHKGAINENYGRELLELFSMGVGNYTEDDIKECARAFTGWTIRNKDYVRLKAQNDSLWPYGRTSFEFQYIADDHDDGEKTFLGEKGNFNGEDIIRIICKQEATGRFISRHLYSFFVADEPPVTKWPYEEPRDGKAIEALTKVYLESGYNIMEVLRFLFNSEFFKSSNIRNTKIKGPAELVASILRVTGEITGPNPSMMKYASQVNVMGQELINPPSVEGWHQGLEWIDTGTTVERVNFSSAQIGDSTKPGIKNAILRLIESECTDPSEFIDRCTDELGFVYLTDKSRKELINYLSAQNNDGFNSLELGENDVANILRMIASTPDYQRA
ncbi:MAG: DUF1800 domain-containing protein [SAR202 cluster bacterium]|nr:DUF1800 domain-containing protein [SAR202 cluster bacterium]